MSLPVPSARAWRFEPRTRRANQTRFVSETLVGYQVAYGVDHCALGGARVVWCAVGNLAPMHFARQGWCHAAEDANVCMSERQGDTRVRWTEQGREYMAAFPRHQALFLLFDSLKIWMCGVMVR